jgi:nitrogen fixation/metabolism regulation signal transduction histidine kinase
VKPLRRLETASVCNSVAHMQWQLLAVAATLAQGDLTVQVPVEGRDELSSLMLSLHHIKESLTLILLRVQDSARSVASAAQQIAQANADLSNSSQTITDIVAVIDSIAFQTNILALNAAVETARAGDQGRGHHPGVSKPRRCRRWPPDGVRAQRRNLPPASMMDKSAKSSPLWSVGL